MKYKKIKLSWNKHPDFLNRTFWIRSDIDLFTLGVIALESMNAMYDEDFGILADGTLYLYRPEQEELVFDVDCDQYRKLEDFGFEDLNDHFTLLYNDVDNLYEFTCMVEGEQILSENQYAYLLDGKCRCLFEDNEELLSKYASGKVKKTLTMRDIANKTLFIPSNIDFEQISEIEDYDLEEEQFEFNMKMDADTFPNIVEDVCEQYDMDYDDDNDSEDYYDEDYEEDEPNFLRSITEVCFATAVFQIENVPFVQQTFDRLTQTHSEEEAVLMISKVLSEEFEEIITGEYFENNEEYEKKIRGLK